MRFVTVMLFAIILAGCATGGQPLSQKAATQIQEGVTTREDLFRLFGPSMHTARDEHGRVILSWGYSRFGAAEGLAVVVSDEGKAIGYHLMAGPSPSSLSTKLKRDAPPPEKDQVSPGAGSSAAAPSTVLGRYCDAVEGGHHLRAESVTPGREVLSRSSPLFDSGTIKCRIDRDIRSRDYVLTRIEEGVFGQSSVKYRIYYSDGSGVVQGNSQGLMSYGADNWNLLCKADRIEDTKWCSISKNDLQAGIWKDGASFVSIGHSHFPGSSIAIRVDSKSPYIATEAQGFSDRQAASIIGELSAGSLAITRYAEWPYSNNKEVEVNLFGFRDALSIANRVRAEHSK